MIHHNVPILRVELDYVQMGHYVIIIRTTKQTFMLLEQLRCGPTRSCSGVAPAMVAYEHFCET